MSARPTMRCTIAFDGAFKEVSFLRGISRSAIEAALRDDQPPEIETPSYLRDMPTEDGTYVLVGDQWELEAKR